MVKCLGIFRELQNSPNRQTDDALILKAVMEQLEILKIETSLLEPGDADSQDIGAWDMIIPMCESYPRLMRLKALGDSSGCLIINRPRSVLSCYRTRMLEAFLRTPGLRFPETEIHPVSDSISIAAPPFSSSGLWVKRGDVHNTCNHDVVFARTFNEVEAVRKDFLCREITSLLLQKHIDGDLIKFYGVGPGQWFTWFYHDAESARKLPLDLEGLALQAEKAARAVGLEIFGGDALVSAEGPIYIIDINSWPSFARVRAEASVQIARHLHLKLRAIQDSRSRP